MMEVASPRRAWMARGIGVLAGLEAAVFVVAAVAHLGVRIPLGFAVLAEPRIVDATVVEGLSGLLLGAGAVTVLARSGWAWPVVTFAHAAAAAGLVLGMAALAAGLGPETQTNHVYHRVLLGLLLVGLAVLATPATRAALGRRGRRPRPG